MLHTHPEWLLCESVDGKRQFVCHTSSPFFIGELFDAGSADEGEAILGGTSVGLDNCQTLGSIEFRLGEDEQAVLSPSLVERLNAAIDEYDARLGL